jgi:hypothetical protein
MRRIVLVTASFQDAPGEHYRPLEDAGFEIVRDRGHCPSSGDQLERSLFEKETLCH